MSIYNTEEWRANRKAFVQNKVCEWCSDSEGSEYKDSKGVIRKKTLAPHHRHPPKVGLLAYKKIVSQMYKEHVKKNGKDSLLSKASSELGPYVEQKDLEKRAKIIWVFANRSLINEAYRVYKEKVTQEYLNLTLETAIVMCNRCHYAREKGLVLCKICKKNYHKPKYATCWSCSKT